MFNPADDEKLKHELIPPLMIKRLKNSAVEAQILFSAHNPSLREDPWNAVPHIMGVVERGEWVYICMKQLSEYNNPPLVTVEHYVDFFRQVLEVRIFVHTPTIPSSDSEVIAPDLPARARYIGTVACRPVVVHD